MGSTGSAGHGTELSPAPHLQNVGTPRATLGGHRVIPDQARAKKHPPNSLHCMPLCSISIFNAQQHLLGIQTQGKPRTAMVLCQDAVPTPGRGTHTMP